MISSIFSHLHSSKKPYVTRLVLAHKPIFTPSARQASQKRAQNVCSSLCMFFNLKTSNATLWCSWHRHTRHLPGSLPVSCVIFADDIILYYSGPIPLTSAQALSSAMSAHNLKKSANPNSQKSASFTPHIVLICALQFTDFLRLCLSPRTTSLTISFSISNSFWVGSARRRGNHMHDHSRFQSDIDDVTGVSLSLSLSTGSLLLTKVIHAQYRKRFRAS